ncbi:sulfatase family protein [Tichowtungia aerotolerans]|uniref:Sulfatase-like hydrolase/transferase n=1 Tax=Tichowtungia aerotolerans TaxID=2697043 RepID=A0A6P1MB83_9BACT|nr:sulfatase-like hydrolase/transferase [Tichowtungia aerotolerans]QHI69804.1 sulfatase-like hydrolase/transferase [Tichowtungia aerotolerans]
MSSKSPNIIFVHVDQLRWSAVGANGSADGRTPNMDRILNEGVRFDRSYTACPVCVPARTAWYTGLEPEQSGISENPRWIDRKQVDVTELGTWLSEKAGYDCFYAGKWHIALKPQTTGFTFLHDSNPVGEYGDTPLARAAEDFLLHHQSDKPFFLSVGLLNPHDICYWSFQYTPAKFAIAKDIENLLPQLPPNLVRNDKKSEWSDLQWRFYAYSYFRFVEMVDDEIGRIYRAYRRSPDVENTVFIFSSDHGQGNGEHGVATKNSPYEHSCKVPLAVIDSQSTPRRDRDHMISGLDMAPTICDYAGVEPMPRNHGRSFRPLVRNEQVSWRDRMVLPTPLLRHSVVLKGDYKLIYTRKGGAVQLFHLKNDPWEMHDLSADPAHREVLDELSSLRETYDEQREYCPMARRDLERWM